MVLLDERLIFYFSILLHSGCGDCWNRLAVLINLLEELNYQELLRKNGQQEPILIMEPKNGRFSLFMKNNFHFVFLFFR